MRNLAGAVALVASLALPSWAAADTIIFSNGFETDAAGWNVFGGTFDATRVASGTNGITSASGAFHAESSASGSAGNWGGYNFGAGSVPTSFQEYWTSLDIFLDVDGGWANDTRFDWDSSISDSGGSFLRDFIFNGGFYNDATGPGAGTDRFVISASNNSSPGSAYPKNPGRDPIAIDTSGWYTFEHHFYDNAGALAVDLSIFDSGNALVHSWTLGGDPIAGVGGNQYGWFSDQDFNPLAFDNSELRTAAVPDNGSTLTLLGIGMLVLGWAARWRVSTRSA